MKFPPIAVKESVFCKGQFYKLLFLIASSLPSPLEKKGMVIFITALKKSANHPRKFR